MDEVTVGVDVINADGNDRTGGFLVVIERNRDHLLPPPYWAFGKPCLPVTDAAFDGIQREAAFVYAEIYHSLRNSQPLVLYRLYRLAEPQAVVGKSRARLV